MNEQANFCNQCGSIINSDVKFCSNCGCDLKNSSTKTSLNANIKLETANVKLETTNATLEKGFKSVEKGVKATGEKIGSSMSYILTSLKKIIKLIVKILILGVILYGVAFIGFMLQESYLKNDRDKALQDLKLKIETAQGSSIRQDEWEVFGSDDPASEKKIGTSAKIISSRGLCEMGVEHRIDGTRLTSFNCDFTFDPNGYIWIKFDNYNNIETMGLSPFRGDSYYAAGSAYVKPTEPVNTNGTIPSCAFDYSCPEPLFSYGSFIEGLISSNAVAIKLIPTINHEYYSFHNYATGTRFRSDERINLDPVWIKFPLKGAKEAIAKLGKEMETVPNISND
jgi:hypothetical protein